MSYTLSKTLTFAEFLLQYLNNLRYELADGEPIDMEPTGPMKPSVVNSQPNWALLSLLPNCRGLSLVPARSDLLLKLPPHVVLTLWSWMKRCYSMNRFGNGNLSLL